MKKRHNLGTVIAFEFFRTIKKKSFWLATLSVPLLLVVVFGLVFISTKSSVDRTEELKDSEFSIQYTDQSGLINPEIMAAVGASEANDRATGINSVKSGDIDAYFYYNQDLTQDGIEVYGQDVGLFDNEKYSAVAQQLLTASIDLQIEDKTVLELVRSTPTIQTTTFKDNHESKGWTMVIAPLIFLVLFFLIITMLGNNLLNSTVEEKENRVTEMILTTLNPTSLVVGKLIATFLAGAVQGAVLLVPLLFVYFNFGTQLNIPAIDLQSLAIDPTTMLFGLIIMIGGLLVFTGSLVAIGAVMPTAKEAGQWFSICILLMFVPLYILNLILTEPSAWIVQLFLYFPLSAPITALMMNAFGSLSVIHAIIVCVELFVVGIAIIRLAVYLFRYGALEYNQKLSISSLLARKKASHTNHT